MSIRKVIPDKTAINISLTLGIWLKDATWLERELASWGLIKLHCSNCGKDYRIGHRCKAMEKKT